MMGTLRNSCCCEEVYSLCSLEHFSSSGSSSSSAIKAAVTVVSSSKMASARIQLAMHDLGLSEPMNASKHAAAATADNPRTSGIDAQHTAAPYCALAVVPAPQQQQQEQQEQQQLTTLSTPAVRTAADGSPQLTLVGSGQTLVCIAGSNTAEHSVTLPATADTTAAISDIKFLSQRDVLVVAGSRVCQYTLSADSELVYTQEMAAVGNGSGDASNDILALAVHTGTSSVAYGGNDMHITMVHVTAAGNSSQFVNVLIPVSSLQFSDASSSAKLSCTTLRATTAAATTAAETSCALLGLDVRAATNSVHNAYKWQWGHPLVAHSWLSEHHCVVGDARGSIHGLDIRMLQVSFECHTSPIRVCVCSLVCFA
jgi:hypothetical protein